jgi:SAM-dependent methyltransferase
MVSVLSYVYSQFGRPRGVLGYVADYVMAHRPSNLERNDWALSLLAVKPMERILEIGFGPGITAGKAAANAREVVGVDRSALMLRQAAKRNKELIEKGKLKLMLGTVESLAPELGSFDKIYSMNVVHFWREPVAVFRTLRSLLRPGGLLLTGYMPRQTGAKDEDAVQKGRQIEDWLRAAEFRQVRTETRIMKPVTVVAVLAT